MSEEAQFAHFVPCGRGHAIFVGIWDSGLDSHSSYAVVGVESELHVKLEIMFKYSLEN